MDEAQRKDKNSKGLLEEGKFEGEFRTVRQLLYFITIFMLEEQKPDLLS